MITAREQAQALRGLIDQFGLGQDSPADRDDGIGCQHEAAAQVVVELDRFQRSLGLGAGQPVGAGARQFAPLRGFIDIGGTQRGGLDAGLIEQGETSWRSGRENEFGTA
jgi:hypothetical protein